MQSRQRKARLTKPPLYVKLGYSNQKELVFTYWVESQLILTRATFIP